MNWNAITLAIIVCLAAWRALWLAAGVPDTTAIADDIRARMEDQLAAPGHGPHGSPERWRVSMREIAFEPARRNPILVLDRIGVDQWDAELPIWITPGRDRQPGWAGWDDNGNGTVDESAELGAAWSDDGCIVELPGQQPPSGRIIDHGAFRPVPFAAPEPAAQRIRFNARYMRDAP